jgi:HSP20 family protein
MKIHVSHDGKAAASDPAEAPGRWEEKTVETRETQVRCRETDSALDLTLDMPGVEPGGLEVTLKERKLTVVLEHKEEKRTMVDGAEKVERSLERRTKEVDLPCDVDPAKVEAVYRDGALHVKLGKRGDRKVEVKHG